MSFKTIEFEGKTINQGDWVRIKSGADIKSTNPSQRRFQSRRVNTVEVASAFPAYPGNPDLDLHARPAEISYVGTGGYWCYVHPKDILDVVEKPARREARFSKGSI